MVIVSYVKDHLNCWLNIEKEIDCIAEADVLGALTYIEPDSSFPFSFAAGVELYYSVLKVKSGKGWL